MLIINIIYTDFSLCSDDDDDYSDDDDMSWKVWIWKLTLYCELRQDSLLS